MTSAALRFERVSLVAVETSKELLRDVSLEIDVGETIALLGESGCGKTLLGSLCAGFHPADTLVRRNDSGDWLDAISLPRGVVVPQSPGRWLPAAETIGDLLRAALQEWAWVDHDNNISVDACALLREFGFDVPERLLDQIPDELSGGMSQRVAIAVAAALKPAICFLDEPTSGLDPIVRKRVKSALRSIRHRFGTLLIATHDIEFIAGLADRILVIRGGAIFYDGTLRSALCCADPYIKRFVSPD